MNFPKEFNNKIDYLIKLCEKYKVVMMFVFGSLVKGNFNAKKSDVDLIAKFEYMHPEEKGKLVMKLWDELEDLFELKVDLVTNMDFINPYLKKDIKESKVLLHNRAS